MVCSSLYILVISQICLSVISESSNGYQATCQLIGKSGRVVLGIHKSKAEFLTRRRVLYAASEGQSPECELQLEELEPDKLNVVTEDGIQSSCSFLPAERTAGKPGFISFHGLPYQRQEEILESGPSKEISRIFWFTGPTVLVAFLVLPSLYLRRVLSTVFEDSLLTGSCYLSNLFSMLMFSHYLFLHKHVILWITCSKPIMFLSLVC